ncbi:MAG TPA: transporter, partial [Rhizomicrobium sp.]
LQIGHAAAGPPYISDDPEPTDYQHFEIYAYTDGTTTRDGAAGEAGIDFNYGAAPDLQLTAVMPLGYESPAAAQTTAGLGNIALAAKYRFLHQSDFGFDVAVFPRLFLPSDWPYAGTRHTSFFLPVWIEKDWGDWSMFGGGGCELNRGENSQNFCQAGWVLARKILPDLQLGAELFHQTADTRGGGATTGIGAGFIYDINENYHLMAYLGPGIQNAAANDQNAWYAAIQFTF